MLSTSTIPPPKPDEPSDATERKWCSDFLAISRSLAPFSPADRSPYYRTRLEGTPICSHDTGRFQAHPIRYNESSRTSITLAYAPGISFQTVSNDFVANRMLIASMELISKDFRNANGRPTLLVHGNRLRAPYAQQFCAVAFGTQSGCAPITASYPTDSPENIKSQLETSLLNSRYEGPD